MYFSLFSCLANHFLYRFAFSSYFSVFSSDLYECGTVCLFPLFLCSFFFISSLSTFLLILLQKDSFESCPLGMLFSCTEDFHSKSEICTCVIYVTLAKYAILLYSVLFYYMYTVYVSKILYMVYHIQ